MIIDQWGFYDPGYFPEDEMTLDFMTLHQSFVRNDLTMNKVKKKGYNELFILVLPVFELKTAHSTLFWLDSIFSYLL